MPESNKSLQYAKLALDEALLTKKITKQLIDNLGPVIAEVQRELLGKIVDAFRMSKKEIIDGVGNMVINPWNVKIPDPNSNKPIEVKIPEIKVPNVHVPQPQVTVNVPEQPSPLPAYDGGTATYSGLTEVWKLTKHDKPVATIHLTYKDEDKTQLESFKIDRYDV